MAGGENREEESAEEPLVFTVGHSSRSVQDLAELLAEHGVRTLVDVRA